MGKISSYGPEFAPVSADYVVLVDQGTLTTKRMLLGTFLGYIFDQDNISASATANPVLRMTDSWNDFVASGAEWTPDNPGVNRNASMSVGVAYAAGKRFQPSAVAARTFTASRDTYVTMLDDGTIDYEEETNGATPPTYASGAVPIALVVTDASAVTEIYSLAPRNPDEIARVRIDYGSGIDSMSVVNIPAKLNLEVAVRIIGTGGTTNNNATFNGDSGSNYAYRQINNHTQTTSSSQSLIPLESGATASGEAVSAVVNIMNVQSSEKIVYTDSVTNTAAGAATEPSSYRLYAKWANSSDQVDMITIDNVGTGDYDVDSEIIVKGRD